MGLLGHILEVEFTLSRIPSPWLYMESRRVDSIDEYLEALGHAASRWPMTMGWIDCLPQGQDDGSRHPHGRPLGDAGGSAGRAAAGAHAPHVAPGAPELALNSATVRPSTPRTTGITCAGKRSRIVAPDPFFYPLDAILHWNRVYGPRGFTQYQCVVPARAGGRGARFMALLTRLGGASPLCVIKDCGPEGKGLLVVSASGRSR